MGILGGTGPAGRGFAVRLASAGIRSRIGSRDPERAATVAAELRGRGPTDRLDGGRQCGAAASTSSSWRPRGTRRRNASPAGEPLAGKVVVSMANALIKEGRELLALIPPRGSMAAPSRPPCRTAGDGRLPPPAAAEMEDLESGLEADVLVCSDYPEATAATVALVEQMPGLRPLDAGSLSQAAAIEAFTAVCITLNIRHKAHSTLRIAGL